MSFAIQSLSLLNYANGFSLWHYRAREDTLPVLERPGYFGDAASLLATGDLVIADAPDGGDLLRIVVDGGTVTAESMLAARWHA